MIDRYNAKRAMRQELREAHPEVRFFDAWRMAQTFPEAWPELERCVRRNGLRFADCVFYETLSGVGAAFVTVSPDEVWFPEECVA
jgi:hypothetical protein